MDAILDPAPPPAVTPPAPSKPRVWTVWLVFVALCGVMLVGSVLAFAVLLFVQSPELLHGRPTPQALKAAVGGVMKSPSALLAMTPVAAVIHITLSLAAAALSGQGLARRLRLRPSGLSAAEIAAAVVGFLAFSEISDALFMLLGLGDYGSLGATSKVVRSATAPQLLWLTLAVGLGAGVPEELFFRGYMQTRFEERWGRRVGIAVTAVCFAVVHMDLLHSLFAFGAGVYLGWVASRAGSIRVSMVVHSINNAVWVLATGFLPELSGRGPAAALLVVCLAVSVLCTKWLARRFDARDPTLAPLPVAAAP